jgi:hypothetical protein
MKRVLGVLGAGFLLAGCGGTKDGDHRTSSDPGGGGSMAGAGGAGPGFEGSGQGAGKYGTVPDGAKTNVTDASQPQRTAEPPPQPPPVPQP